jgi:hypothetical protein
MIPIYELRNIREASGRSEFYTFMTIGLKDLLFKAYRESRVTYPQLVTMATSTKDKEGFPSMGVAPLPEQVLEGQPYNEHGLPKSDLVELTNLKFGEIIAITQELIDDDQTGQIAQLPLGLGNAHAKHEDKTIYSIVTGNATGYDSQAIFSLNHPGFVGGPAIASNDNIYTSVTMSANAVAVALGLIGGWTGHTTDDFLDVVAKNIVCPRNLKYTANLLTQSELLPMAYAAGVFGPAAQGGGGKNVLREEGLGVISSARLDRVSATDWYIQTDFPGLVMQWRERLQFLAEGINTGTQFDRDVYRWKSKARWVAKMLNWRWGMLVS